MELQPKSKKTLIKIKIIECSINLHNEYESSVVDDAPREVEDYSSFIDTYFMISTFHDHKNVIFVGNKRS